MTSSQRRLAAFFTVAGLLHFIAPRTYRSMVPPELPAHREIVIVSGIAEIAGGVAVAHPSTRALARWWLLGLLLAVFPANIDMYRRPHLHGLERMPRWLLLARLPFQPLMMWWVWHATRPRPQA